MKFFEPHLYILLESHRIQIIFLWNNLIQVMIKDYFSYFITPFHVQHSWHFPFLNEYATVGGQGGPWSPSLQFSNQTRSKSFIFKHQEYCFFRMFRNYTDQKFQNFYRACCNFWTLYGGFSFFLITYEK